MTSAPFLGSSSSPDPATPNEKIHDGDRDGSYPQALHANNLPTPPNVGHGGDRRNGTMPVTGSTGLIKPPNEGGFSIGASGNKIGGKV